MHGKSLQLCPTFCNPMDYSPPAPLSMGFSRQEYWIGLPCPPPGDLPDPEIEPVSLSSPALTGGSLPLAPPGKPSQFSRSVMSDSLRPHGLQHARLPCPSQLLKLAQTHVHRDGDAIQSTHPLSSPSPPTFNLSQHQHLFKWVSSSHQVAKVLEFQLQYWSFQWIFRIDFL